MWNNAITKFVSSRDTHQLTRVAIQGRSHFLCTAWPVDGTAKCCECQARRRWSGHFHYSLAFGEHYLPINDHVTRPHADGMHNFWQIQEAVCVQLPGQNSFYCLFTSFAVGRDYLAVLGLYIVAHMTTTALFVQRWKYYKGRSQSPVFLRDSHQFLSDCGWSRILSNLSVAHRQSQSWSAESSTIFTKEVLIKRLKILFKLLF